jgi:hypothetical protein
MNNEVSITHKETPTSFSITFHFNIGDKGSFTQTFFLETLPSSEMTRLLVDFIDKIFVAKTTDWIKLTKDNRMSCKFEIKSDRAVFYVKECDKHGLEIRQCTMSMYNMPQFDSLYSFLNDLKFYWLVR